MNTFNTLMNAVSAAAEITQDAIAARDAFLEPILVALGADDGGGISGVWVGGDRLHVDRIGSCRGCEWNESYEFPIAIFTAADPMKEAAEYVAAKKKAGSNGWPK